MRKILPQTAFAATANFLARHRLGLGVFVGLFVLFGLLGYFWLPGFAKGKAEELLAAKLHRPVSIAKIDINPYALSLTVHDLRIGGKEGEQALFGFESLYVNLSSLSIARAAPVVSAVTLKAPLIHLERGADGKLSIADLIEEFMNQPESEPARFSVSNILIEGGRIEFDDRLKKSKQVVSDLHLGLPFIANFASAEETWVQPHFSARIDGSLFEIEGKARPFAEQREISLEIKLQDLDLTGVDEYAPVIKDLHLLAGKLDTQLDVLFSQPKDQAPQISVTGDVVLRELSVNNSSSLPWKLGTERLVLHVDGLDPLLKRPLKAEVVGQNIRMKQGNKPELLLNKLALNNVQADMEKHSASFVLESTVNSHGSLNVSGGVGWAPVIADLKIDARDVDIVALQGWAAASLNATSLTKGAFSFGGAIKAMPAVAGDLNIAVTGNARLAGVNLLDEANSQDLLRFRSLDVSGIALQTAPLDVTVDSVSLADFFARVMITPEGKLNLNSVFRQEEVEAKKEAQSAAASDGKVKAAPVAASETKPVRIGSILLQGGSLDFEDRFIKPSYRVNLSKLGGKIGPLKPGTQGQIMISGAIAKTAPLQIQGRLDPFAAQSSLDITAKAKGIDLPSFSPYSGKYVGYAIEKGKLSVDVHYLIDKGQLRAENNIFIDQLTFGDKIENSTATSLPVNLAVALLKNSRGEIDLNLPISGSLDDPEFSVGGLVWKVFVNLITKAVTSPFALLGSMFGGGADLSQLDFAPGYARLTPEAEKNLDAMAKAMSARPALKLEITGVADPVNDKDGLKRATLERRVKAQKLADMAKQGQSGGSLGDVVVSPGEYPKYLEQAYKAEKFDKPRNLIGLSKSLPVPEMEQLLLAHFAATQDEMQELASRRADNTREALLARGVAADRIFVLQPKLDAQPDSKKITARAEFSLK